MNQIADTFETLAREQCAILPQFCFTLRDGLRYLREHPDIPAAGMAVGTLEGDAYVDIFSARDIGELAGWSQVYSREEAYKTFRFFLYADGQAREIAERATFFARLYTVLTERRTP